DIIGVGYMSEHQDGRNLVTTYDQRSHFGNVIEITRPDKTKNHYERDDLDLVLSYRDGNGHLTTYDRDGKHRVKHIEHADGTTEDFTYNEFGEVKTHTLRNHGVEKYTYDERGLKIKYEDALGNKTFY